MDKLKLIAAFDFLPKQREVGLLSHDRVRGADVYVFEFAPEWLRDFGALTLSRDISNYAGKQTATELFACIADSLPDRWGRTLINIKESLTPKTNTRTLSDWDYLMNVSDAPRSGAFRFVNAETGTYIGINEGRQVVPPITTIDELMEAAYEVERKVYHHMAPDEKWIRRLLQPGSSVGGARPKANVIDGGNIFIAKFPSLKDEYDIGRWEQLANILARQCGINVPETRLLTLHGHHNIFLTKRFDRTADGRRTHMASSLTLTGLHDGDGWHTGKGYLDIVDTIITYSADAESDLAELYRRVAFNICIGNTDDHFRNHAFLLSRQGWRLSPAYDLNPTLQTNQALLIDRTTSESSLQRLWQARADYMMTDAQARDILQHVCHTLHHWESEAQRLNIPQSEIALFRPRIASQLNLSI